MEWILSWSVRRQAESARDVKRVTMTVCGCPIKTCHRGYISREAARDGLDGRTSEVRSQSYFVRLRTYATNYANGKMGSIMLL